MTKKFIIFIGVSVLIVFLVSIYVQPMLSTSANIALWVLFAALVSVISFFSNINGVVNLWEKIRKTKEHKAHNENSLSLYVHKNPPYNAVKMLYTGTEIAKDLQVRIEYTDIEGKHQLKLITDFFPKNDTQMIWHIYKYDFLEPNQVAYFRLVKRKTTLDGTAMVHVKFTKAITDKQISIKQSFTLKDF